MYVDVHETSLGARRAKLYLQYATKIKSLPNHPAHENMKLFDARPSAIRTFGLRIKQFLTASNIKCSDILETPSYFILPIYQQLFLEIRDRYRDYIPVYTDGSRITVFSSDTEVSMRFPNSASIFTAEFWAIIKTLEEIKNASASIYIIFTDLLPCLQALLYVKLEHPLIGMVIRKCVFLNIVNKDIILCWVPSHIGIRGNVKADSAAKSDLDLPRAHVGVPYT